MSVARGSASFACWHFARVRDQDYYFCSRGITAGAKGREEEVAGWGGGRWRFSKEQSGMN